MPTKKPKARRNRVNTVQSRASLKEEVGHDTQDKSHVGGGLRPDNRVSKLGMYVLYELIIANQPWAQFDVPDTSQQVVASSTPAKPTFASPNSPTTDPDGLVAASAQVESNLLALGHPVCPSSNCYIGEGCFAGASRP